MTRTHLVLALSASFVFAACGGSSAQSGGMGMHHGGMGMACDHGGACDHCDHDGACDHDGHGGACAPGAACPHHDDGAQAAAAGPVVPPGEAHVGDTTTCPVSGERFVVTEQSPHAEYEGRTYYFCCPNCVGRFQANPAQYAHPAATTTPPPQG